MIRAALILAFVVWPALTLLDAIYPAWKGGKIPVIAVCDTDSDCIHHCPADDGECDGGPQE